MAVRQVITWGDPRLKNKNQDIGEWSPELDQLVADLFETSVAQEGAGVAAPQVGVNIRLAVVDVSSVEGASIKHVLINPEIVKTEGEQTDTEGCLSIPGIQEPITRARKVWVKNRKPDGSWEELEAEGYLARAMQHEIDHLMGRLFVEYLGPVKRDLLLRQYKKRTRN